MRGGCTMVVPNHTGRTQTRRAGPADAVLANRFALTVTVDGPPQ